MSDMPHPIPEDNEPGHHPEVEQDKPNGPPRGMRVRKHHRFELRRDEPFARASRFFGVTEDNSYVSVDDDQLEVRFGPWTLTTSIDNVEGAEVTGPFAWWKVIGPPHLSLKDRGITFATSAERGVCIRFRQPVPALDAVGLIRHPAATVTAEDPEKFARFINEARARM